MKVVYTNKESGEVTGYELDISEIEDHIEARIIHQGMYPITDSNESVTFECKEFSVVYTPENSTEEKVMDDTCIHLIGG